MKVSFVYLSQFPWKEGLTGGDRRFRDFCIGFQENGISVDVYIPSKFKKNCDVSLQPLLNINFLGCLTRIPTLHRFCFWLHLFLKIIVTRTSVLFLYNTNLDGAIFSMLIRLFRVKVIYEICDLHFTTDDNYYKKRIWQIALWIYGKTSLIIVISNYLKKMILEINKKANVYISPIHIDTHEFKEIFNNKNMTINKDWLMFIKNKIVFTYLGSFYSHEGVDILLKGFLEFKKKGDNNCVLIVGGRLSNDTYVASLQKFVQESGLQDSVLFTDWLKVDQVKDIYKISDVLCLPQIECLWNLAGMPTKLAEYSCTGKAIILTSVGDVNDYFLHKENSFVVKSDSSSEIAEAMYYLAKNNEERVKLGKGAFDLGSRSFDSKKNAKKIIETFLLNKS